MNHNLKSVLDYLDENSLKLVTAESCTAGLIASTLAEVPGSAKWLECAFVTYSENAKTGVLGVRQETIDRYGLTSEQVAREMAEGALRLSRANVALADTGVAGPGSSEDGVPAGTVCLAWLFAAGNQRHVFSETRRFSGDRNQVREAASEYAISRVWHYHNSVQLQGKDGGTPQLPG